MQADAMDGDATMLRTFDNHAHVAKGLQSRQGVFALKETFDLSGAFGQRAKHDRAVRNGFVARNTNPARQAAARLGEVNQIIRMHSVHISPAGQNFAEMLTCYPSAGKHAQHVMSVAGVDRRAQGVKIATKGIEYPQYRIAVGEKNVMPHHRIAAGNPGEIAKTTGGVAEYLQVLAAFGQRINQTEGQQMRQMAGGGEHFVVMLDFHVLDIGAQLTPEPINHLQRSAIGIRQRRENHLMAAEQLTITGLYPALLGAGNGVPRDKTRRHAVEGQRRRAYHIAFGAAHVRQHGITQRQLRQGAQQLLHGQNRHRQLDHIRAHASRRQVFLAAINHAQLNRHAAGFGIEVDADHFAK